MKWEELTATDFAAFVKKCGGVCIVSPGCLEKHGEHLPLGTDFLNGTRLAELAARREEALVFPHWYFSQIHEARCFPGTIAIDPVLTIQLLLNVFDEISRNGCHKIILNNAHGGNNQMLVYLGQIILHKRTDYALYIPTRLYPEWREKEWNQTLTTPVHGHACECETSVSLASFPDLVKMDRLKGWKTDPLNRLSHLPPGFVSNCWYADFPEHYAGDATAASVEKGQKLLELRVGSLADYIKAVKNDQVTPSLMKEFYDRCDRVGK